MLKKNLNILFTALLVISLIFSCSATFADEITPDVNAASTTNSETTTIISGDNTNENSTEEAKPEENSMNTQEDSEHEHSENEVNLFNFANIFDGDKYLFEDNVNIDQIIDGNVLIISNSVTINAPIGGDALIIANDITIGENGYINSNLFAAANTIKIEGNVYDVYACTSENFEIADSGSVYRDLHVATSKVVNLSGAIGRSAYISGTNQINIKEPTDQSRIFSNLYYEALEEISDIPENSVKGEVHFEDLSTKAGAVTPIVNKLQSALSQESSVLSIAFDIIGSLIFLLFAYIIAKCIAPKFVEKSSDTIIHPVRVILASILSIILIPIVAFIFLLPILTAKITIALLVLYFVLIGLSTVATIMTLNSYVCKKANVTGGAAYLLLLLIGAIVYGLKLLPVVGIYISLVIMVVGMGTIISYLTTHNKKVEDSDSTKLEKESSTSKENTDKANSKVSDSKADNKEKETKSDTKKKTEPKTTTKPKGNTTTKKSTTNNSSKSNSKAKTNAKPKTNSSTKSSTNKQTKKNTKK